MLSLDTRQWVKIREQLLDLILNCVYTVMKQLHIAASYARNCGGMRQNSLPSRTSAYYTGTDVGLFCRSGTYRECRPTGRALLLCESSGRQECGHAKWWAEPWDTCNFLWLSREGKLLSWKAVASIHVFTWVVCLMTKLSSCFCHHLHHHHHHPNHHHHLLFLLQGRPQMPCSIPEGILPVCSCSSSNSDYFGLLIHNTLDECSWFHTLHMFIPSNFIALNSFICII